MLSTVMEMQQNERDGDDTAGSFMPVMLMTACNKKRSLSFSEALSEEACWTKTTCWPLVSLRRDDQHVFGLSRKCEECTVIWTMGWPGGSDVLSNSASQIM